MRVVQINATCGIGSTGKICVGISRSLTQKHITNFIIYSSRSDGSENGIAVSNDKYIKRQALKSRLLGNCGFNSEKATKKIISELEKIKPDIVHLHNIHGHDCNLAILFNFFRKNHTKLVWTFHDCWAFTAYCPYFDLVQCNAWQGKCKNCPQKSRYSWFLDRSNYLFDQKQKLFSGLDLTIVTPSQWLANIVRKSFLKDYPVYVINNGIDLSVFRPTKSDFREKYKIKNKHIVLGVAFDWGIRKGLDVFVALSKVLPDHYQIVLVGTDERTERKLPENMITIRRTQNQQELAQIYTVADVYINPTREDNYPTVNLEALSCGTPVITYRTGGSAEMLDDTCGAVVECDNIEALKAEIIRICETNPYSRDACTRKAKMFDMNERYKEYVALYEKLLNP